VVFFAFLALQHFTVFYSILHVGGFDEPLSFGQILLAISASRYHSYTATFFDNHYKTR
jgi:hypothetical protein